MSETRGLGLACWLDEQAKGAAVIRRVLQICAIGVLVAGAAMDRAVAQAPAPTTAPAAPQGRGGGRGNTPQFVSPEVAADRKVTFRVHAPNAQAVRLSAGDIPGTGQNTSADQGRERRLGT